jgi:hypothetical protein
MRRAALLVSLAIAAGSADDAAKAAKQLELAVKDPSRSAALRVALAKTRPRAIGSELLIDISGFFESLDAIKEATAELAKRLPDAGTAP